MPFSAIHTVHIIHTLKKRPFYKGLRTYVLFYFAERCDIIPLVEKIFVGVVMCELALYRDCDPGSITVSNSFIDEFLADANDCQIKVYLYLIRMLSARKPTGISDIADKFNHTEKDVCRSLRYWEKKGVLSLDYDSNGGIVGIGLHEPSRPRQPALSNAAPAASGHSDQVMKHISVVTPDEASLKEVSATSLGRPNYSPEQLKEFSEREDTPQIIFVAEQYLKRTLSPNDIRSLLFYRDELGFNADLIDYLLQFCISLGKKSFAYMDKVAVDWAEKDIDTVKKARDYTSGTEHSERTGRRAQTASSTVRKKQNTTMFHQFEQNSYDFGTLEKQLLKQ